MKKRDLRKTVLGFATGATALVLLFVAWVYPEVPTASYFFSAILVVLLGAMAWLYQRELRAASQTRAVRYGTNTAVTIGLVFAILIVVNFLNFSHFIRKDLTTTKRHSLSEQTIKVVKDIKNDIKLTVFVKTAERDAAKSVIDNYLYHTKKITAEYVDPDRDPVRAKAANVKKYGTMVVSSGTRDTRVDEINEEKLTNALLKVLKEKAISICFLTGHGERSFETTEATSFSQLKGELGSQNYEAKAVNLVEEGKIPADCSVVLVMGPQKAFFEKELTALKDWVLNGGRALFAIDPPIKGGPDYTQDLKRLLAEHFFITFSNNLVLDPTSRLLKVTEAVPVVAIYSKEHAITREFQAASLFPLTSTLEALPNPPASLKTWWLTKSTPKAFATTDLKTIAAGKPVTLDETRAKPGPHVLMLAAEGDAKNAKKEGRPVPRVVVMGTSQVATNQWIRYAANADLFLNAVSWLADDESLISIRPKDEANQMPSLQQTSARYIQLVTMILLPGGILMFGAFIWVRRRRL